MIRGNLVMCAHAPGLAMKRADTTVHQTALLCLLTQGNNICSKPKVRLIHRSGKQCSITMSNSRKACVCEMCARNRSYGNYLAVVG